MVFTVSPSDFENGEVSLSVNGSNELIVTNKATGKPCTIDTTRSLTDIFHGNGDPYYPVQSESDLTPLDNGDLGTYLVDGAVEISSTITLVERQVLTGLGSLSKFQPSGNFNVVEIVPSGFSQQSLLSNLTIDIVGAAVSTYTSSAIRFTSGGPPSLLHTSVDILTSVTPV